MESVSDLRRQRPAARRHAGLPVLAVLAIALLAVAIVPLLAVGVELLRPPDQVRLQAAAGQRGRPGLHGAGDADHDQPRPGLRPGAATSSRSSTARASSARDAVLRTARLEAVFGFTVSRPGGPRSSRWSSWSAPGWSTSDAITAGDCSSTFILLIQDMFKPTRRIIKEWNTVAKVYASVERVGELLDREPAVQDLPDARRGAAAARRDRVPGRQLRLPAAGRPDGRRRRTPLGWRCSPSASRWPPARSWRSWGTAGRARARSPSCCPGCTTRRRARSSRRPRHPHVHRRLAAGADQHGAAGDDPAARHGRREHRLRPGGRHAARTSCAPPAGARPRLHHGPAARATTPCSASGRRRCRAASASGWPSPGPSSGTPRSSSSTSRRPGLDAESVGGGGRGAAAPCCAGRSALIVSHDLNLIRGGGPHPGAVRRPDPRGGHARPTCSSGAGSTPTCTPASSARPPPSCVASPAVAEPSLAGGDSTFETVLLDAVPVPASEQQFRQLTGWVGRRRRRPPGGPDRDPRRSPALTQALPGLAEASDAHGHGAPPPAAARRRLGARLLPARQGRSSTWAAAPALRYRAEAAPAHQWRGGGAQRRRPAPPDGGGGAGVCRAAGGRRRRPALARGREGLRPARSTSCPRCAWSCTRFPLDPDLPGLVAATDPARMAAILEPVLPERRCTGLELQGCRAEVVKYALGGQCVLRYELLWRVQPSRRTVRQVVYGKVYADERGSHVGPTVTALHERLHAERAAPAVPAAPLPGVPARAAAGPPGGAAGHPAAAGPGAVLGGGRASERPDGVDRRERARDLCADSRGASRPGAPALVLPGAASGGQDRTLQGELDGVQHDLEALAAYAPALAALLRGRLEALAAGRSRRGPAAADHPRGLRAVGGPVRRSPQRRLRPGRSLRRRTGPRPGPVRGPSVTGRGPGGRPRRRSPSPSGASPWSGSSSAST